jgi:hypothetical protein
MKRYSRVILAVLLAACDGSISDQEQRMVTVHVDLGATLQQLSSTANSFAILDSVILTATTGATPARQAVKFTPAQVRYTFQVGVDRGTVTLTAQVSSSNRIVLLNRTISTQLFGPFTFNQLEPVAPIPVVGPDSLFVGVGFPGVITIANRGRSALTWNAQALPAGVTVTPMSGSLAENATAEIRLGATGESLGRQALELNSNVGTLRLPLNIGLVTPPPPPIVWFPSITTATGQAVNAGNVQGQIRVNVEVDYPPFFPMDSLRVQLDNSVVCTYQLAAAPNHGTYACDINTTERDPATGTLRFPNGTRVLNARLFGGTLITATTQTPLVFNN